MPWHLAWLLVCVHLANCLTSIQTLTCSLCPGWTRRACGKKVPQMHLQRMMLHRARMTLILHNKSFWDQTSYERS